MRAGAHQMLVAPQRDRVPAVVLVVAGELTDGRAGKRPCTRRRDGTFRFNAQGSLRPHATCGSRVAVMFMAGLARTT